MTDMHQFTALPKLMRKNRVSFQGGKAVQWNLNFKESQNARQVGFFEQDVINVDDGLQTASIGWTHTTTNYAYDKKEMAMNQGDYEILDLVETRRAEAEMGLAKLFEQHIWGKPADSTDVKTPYGIQYWIVPNATKGFNGGTPAGFSDVAGLSTTTFARWRNWTDTYATVSRTDLFDAMREAAKKTFFKSPIEYPAYAESLFASQGIYTDWETLKTMEKVMEEYNDNLGVDIAMYQGKMVFHGNPVEWVPLFDDDAEITVSHPVHPVYMIDWSWLRPCFLSGRFMVKTGPRDGGITQHESMVYFIDTSWNLMCRDRRRQAVIYQA
jgi:hypothetical protein